MTTRDEYSSVEEALLETRFRPLDDTQVRPAWCRPTNVSGPETLPLQTNPAYAQRFLMLQCLLRIVSIFKSSQLAIAAALEQQTHFNINYISLLHNGGSFIIYRHFTFEPSIIFNAP